MPYTNSNAINLFISYASEDQKIADVLAKTLRAAFFNDIEITMMSEFPSGLNWRRFIDKSIAQTDIMIAIATGRLRQSHSFTGTEIGSFSFSMNAAPQMAKFNHLDRRMIPFAVLARVPDTMNEFEGIDIEPASLRDVRFDATNLAGDLRRLDSDDTTSGPDGMIFKLLCDIESIIDQTKDVSTAGPASITRNEQRSEILREHARDLCRQILELMLGREKSVDYPKAKLTVRTQPAPPRNNGCDAIENATIRIEGNCYDAFGLSQSGNTSLRWPEFTAEAENDIARQWRKALTSLISSSQASNFIEDNSILSFDRKKVFRIFKSRVAVYYSNESEFQIYVVEILRRKDYGDDATTLLLKALEVSLAYRFMFLEETSEFSPTLFRATKLGDFKARVSEMVDGLNLLLLTANEYRLNDPKSIIDILGSKATENVDGLYRKWDREKDKLTNAAKDLQKIKEISYSDKEEFIAVISSFCEHTEEMNRNYTAAVLAGLHKRIDAGN
jgi:hypothetical protein